VKLKDNYYSDADLQKLLVIDQSKLDVTRPGVYFVGYTVTDPSGNKARKEERLVRVVEFTGIEELNKGSHISIYPNPSAGLFKVATMQRSLITKIVVINAIGQSVYNQSIKSAEQEVNLTNVNRGLYIIIIQDETGKEYCSKICIE
jgi:hypothetical protein